MRFIWSPTNLTKKRNSRLGSFCKDLCRICDCGWESLVFHLRELFHLILHFSSLKNQAFDETDRLITRSCDNLISGSNDKCWDY